METVNLHNAVIEYQRMGHGKPLVLLHGFPLDIGVWDAILPLLENQFEVLLPNLRGFGKSESTTRDYSLSNMADDVAGLLDHLGIEKSIIAGHSMGGYIALAFARSYPDRLLGLGLISSQVIADSLERRESRYQTAAQVEEFGMESLANNMADKLTSDPVQRAKSLKIILRQPTRGVSSALKALAERHDQTMTLKSLEKPVVIVHGDSDLLIPVERAQEMKGLNPNSFLTIIPGTGHMPMLEKPADTALALQRFL
jgi:3-oxoadipate enol-lactonase